MDQAPKVLGADFELGNFILGAETDSGTGIEASRRLLREIDGVPSRAPCRTSWSCSPEAGASSSGLRADGASDDGLPSGPAWRMHLEDPQDRGRRFLPTNGGCAYIDLDHLELALPETRSAFDHVACWRAMLELAKHAMVRANARLGEGQRLEVLANCSDGHGHSYGSHVNVLLTRAAWDNIFQRRPHYLAYLAAFQVSSIVFTGQGKVGSENGRPHVPYQISQRADFIETLVSLHTTFNRPIVNSRDEPLCGTRNCPAGAPDLARLHVIFFDHTLCQTAGLLRAGTLQLIVALLEAGAVNPLLALDDPLEALACWSADPDLQAKARLVDGTTVTAVELQQRFVVEAQRYLEGGPRDDIVPRAGEIVALWADTLDRLERRDFAALTRRLDWVLKRDALLRAMARRSTLDWTSPAIKHLDHLYASLDERTGLFWAHERAGLVDRVVDDAAIARAGCEPPVDTRAWTRAHLLRCVSADDIDEVDWDVVRLRAPARDGRSSSEWRTVHLQTPWASLAELQDCRIAEKTE